VLVHAELLDQIIRQPVKVKPPDAVRKKFASEEGPRLPVAQQTGAGRFAVFVRVNAAFAQSQDRKAEDTSNNRNQIDQNPPV